MLVGYQLPPRWPRIRFDSLLVTMNHINILFPLDLDRWTIAAFYYRNLTLSWFSCLTNHLSVATGFPPASLYWETISGNGHTTGSGSCLFRCAALCTLVKCIALHYFALSSHLGVLVPFSRMALRPHAYANMLMHSLAFLTTSSLLSHPDKQVTHSSLLSFFVFALYTSLIKP